MYRCLQCDCIFTEDEVNEMDEDGNDICPACGKTLTEDDIAQKC